MKQKKLMLMKCRSVLSFLPVLLFVYPFSGNAMWAPLSNTELIEKSQVIIAGELIGQTSLTINNVKQFLGVLRVDEYLKGSLDHTVVLLALPSPDGLRSSSDIIYQMGQRGLWFLRQQKKTTGIYLADHPHRFLSPQRDADRIKTIRKLLK